MWGTNRLSERDSRDGGKRKSRRSSSPSGRGERGGDGVGGGGRESPGRGVRLSGSNVGRVLRTAYDDALREPVPDEFTDLLGKLD